MDDSNQNNKTPDAAKKTLINWKADTLPPAGVLRKPVDPFGSVVPPASTTIPEAAQRKEPAAAVPAAAKKTMMGMMTPVLPVETAAPIPSPRKKTPSGDIRLIDVESMEDYDPEDMTGTISTDDPLDDSFSAVMPLKSPPASNAGLENPDIAQVVSNAEGASASILEQLDEPGSFTLDEEDIEQALNSIIPPSPDTLASTATQEPTLDDTDHKSVDMPEAQATSTEESPIPTKPQEIASQTASGRPVASERNANSRHRSVSERTEGETRKSGSMTGVLILVAFLVIGLGVGAFLWLTHFEMAADGPSDMDIQEADTPEVEAHRAEASLPEADVSGLVVSDPATESEQAADEGSESELDAAAEADPVSEQVVDPEPPSSQMPIVAEDAVTSRDAVVSPGHTLLFRGRFREGTAVYWFADRAEEDALVEQIQSLWTDQTLHITGYVTPRERDAGKASIARSRAWAVQRFLQRRGLSLKDVVAQSGDLSGDLPLDLTEVVTISFH